MINVTEVVAYAQENAELLPEEEVEENEEDNSLNGEGHYSLLVSDESTIVVNSKRSRSDSILNLREVTELSIFHTNMTGEMFVAKCINLYSTLVRKI